MGNRIRSFPFFILFPFQWRDKRWTRKFALVQTRIAASLFGPIDYFVISDCSSFFNLNSPKIFKFKLLFSVLLDSISCLYIELGYIPVPVYTKMASSATINKIERAHQMYREGRYAEALGFYTDALSLAKNKSQKIALHSNRAACFLKLHDFKKVRSFIYLNR